PQVRAPDTPLFRNCTGDAVCSAKRIGFDIRDNPEVRPRYLEILCQLSNGVGHEAKLLAELAALDVRIRPVVADEVEPVWAPVGRDPLDAMVEGTYAAEVERMKAWIPARIEAVRRMIEAEGVACPSGCEEGATTACERLGRASHRVCTGGRWGSCEAPVPTTGAGGAGGCGCATAAGTTAHPGCALAVVLMIIGWAARRASCGRSHRRRLPTRRHRRFPLRSSSAWCASIT